MELTITIPEPMSTTLRERATQLNVSADDLVMTLLNELATREFADIPQWMSLKDDDWSALEKAIADARATPPDSKAIQPATKDVSELIADLEANPPSEKLLTFEEFWPLWQKFEQELREMDEADSIRDSQS